MGFAKSLCLKCYNRKYRGYQFAVYPKDLEPSENERCVDCGAVAKVQVQINLDEKHITNDPHTFLSYYANLIDFTTLLKRRDRSALLGISQPRQFIEIYLDEIARITQKVVEAVPNLDFDMKFNHFLKVTILHELLHYYGAQSDDFVHRVLEWLGLVSSTRDCNHFSHCRGGYKHG